MVEADAELDVILVPTGGGGLLAGIAVAVKALAPNIEVIGVESEGYPSLGHALGKVAAPTGGTTIAEGIAVHEPGELPRRIAEQLVDDVVVVSEEHIEQGIALGIEIEKTVLEGAGAAGLAALIETPERWQGRRIGVVLTGGNIDTRVLSSVLLRALARSGRVIRLQIEVPDRPGVLAMVADIVGTCRGNIVDVAHHRDQPGVAVKRAMLELSIETRDRPHADQIVNALTSAGLRVTRA
jgi:threonine dehydratase